MKLNPQAKSARILRFIC